jgi:branched-chain amino acid aminotransferase
MTRGYSGEYAALIKSWLIDIMYGNEDHEWGVVVEEKEDL